MAGMQRTAASLWKDLALAAVVWLSCSVVSHAAGTEAAINYKYKLLDAPISAMVFKPAAGHDFSVAAAGDHVGVKPLEAAVVVEAVPNSVQLLRGGQGHKVQSPKSVTFSSKEEEVAQAAFQRLTTAMSNSGRREVSRQEVISVLEPIQPQNFGGGACGAGVCAAGWKDVEERQASVVYQSSLVDLSSFPRRVYIDGGAHAYESSIGGWFLPSFPQASSFDSIYAFEPNVDHGKSYKGKDNLKFIPAGLWTYSGRVNAFSSSKEKMMTITGRSNKAVNLSKRAVRKMQTSVRVMDFHSWLTTNVHADDYVVAKLDIEGAEFEVLDKLTSKG